MKSLTVCLVVRVMSASSGGITESVISIRRLSVDQGCLPEDPNRRAALLATVDRFERHVDSDAIGIAGEGEIQIPRCEDRLSQLAENDSPGSGTSFDDRRQPTRVN